MRSNTLLLRHDHFRQHNVAELLETATSCNVLNILNKQLTLSIALIFDPDVTKYSITEPWSLITAKCNGVQSFCTTS